MGGHVFIVHGDITRFAADAWLVPGGPSELPGGTWMHAIGRQPADPHGPASRVRRWEKVRPSDPEPFVTDLGGGKRAPISWFVDGAKQFLEVAAEFIVQLPPKNDRARHLLALPLVGTGQGGKRLEAGAVARELLPALYELVEDHDVDIALVMIEGAAYSAAQAVRRKEIGVRAWDSLPPELIQRADQLSELARKKNLVLFLGAGIGASAGLPLWGELLDELARTHAKMPDEIRLSMRTLSVLDRAHLIEGRMPKGVKLSEAVADLLNDRSTHYSLAHALLAALPVDEVVTTNYDTLFESASSATHRPVTVLPYSRLTEGNRWLLKMHGCVTRPEDIVLTRENFLTYRERREALAGIVQALLITRHMLFVGFSLDDDNFHHIVRAVRRVVSSTDDGPGNHQPFGTSLMIAPNTLTEELWRGSLQWISFSPAGARREGIRCLDIFLDRLAAGASDAGAHLFDPRYDEVLTPGERELRDELERLYASLSTEAMQSSAFQRVFELMKDLGWR